MNFKLTPSDLWYPKYEVVFVEYVTWVKTDNSCHASRVTNIMTITE